MVPVSVINNDAARAYVKEISERSLDTCIAFEHVEELDVLCCEARDQRATDAVLLRGELASQKLLAPHARNDSGVIRKLNEKRVYSL